MDLLSFNTLVSNLADIDINRFHNEEWQVNGLTILKLRDIIISLGQIYYEDLENNIYIASICGGFLKKNPATTAFKLESGRLTIAISANEGLIKQDTCEVVIHEIRKKMESFIE